MMEEISSVIFPLPPNSYIILPPLTDQKDVRVGGNLSFTLSLSQSFTLVGSLMQPKKT